MTARNACGQQSAPADSPPAKDRPKRAYELALASYTFRKFPLDKALAMTARVGLKHICLKDCHLPLRSTPEQIARTAAKVKAAGIDPSPLWLQPEDFACVGALTPAELKDVNLIVYHATPVKNWIGC